MYEEKTEAIKGTANLQTQINMMEDTYRSAMLKYFFISEFERKSITFVVTSYNDNCVIDSLK